MTIGIDLSSLQGAHRMRGIGYTLLNFINNLSLEDRKQHHYVFYAYPDNALDPVSLLDVSDMDYEMRPLKHRRRSQKKLPGYLRFFISAYNQLVELRDLRFGDSRINDLSGIDMFLQTDQSESLPRRYGIKKVLIIYDMIPYALEQEYLWSYSTARLHGFSRKAAFRCYVRRKLYGYKLKVNTRRAHHLLAISEQTKQDFIKFIGTPAKKIIVTPLGVSQPRQSGSEPQLHKYQKTSWGYLARPLELGENETFILFVGGADRRRRLNDLVTAFNHLRAQGHQLKLVLAGDSMQGPESIATEEIQYALKASSYIDDIIFMGFVDDQTRDWLYRHALAFVFPSVYEGFGLPVLEAMTYGCPVISYPNLATKEVAANLPYYVTDALGIADTVLSLAALSEQDKQKLAQKYTAHTENYSWTKTSHAILNAANKKT